MISIYRKIMGVSLFLTMLNPVASYAVTKLTIAPAQMKFDYEETDSDGSFLDGESGYIRGYSIDLASKGNSADWFGLAYECFHGDVEYNGHILSNNAAYNLLPIRSKTNQDISSFSIKFSKAVLGYPQISVYGEYSVKRWERDIKSTFFSGSDNFGNSVQNLSVSGIFEIYEWQQLNLGLSYRFVMSPLNNIFFKAGLLRTNKSTMRVSGLNFDLGESWGYEVSVSWMHELSQAHRLGIRSGYIYWEFGRSNIVSGFVEPDSVSKMQRLNFVYEHIF